MLYVMLYAMFMACNERREINHSSEVGKGSCRIVKNTLCEYSRRATLTVI